MEIIKNNLVIYQEGNQINQPVIFVHGFPYDHNMWINQVKKFQDKYFCVTYDIRGLGKSPPGDGQYTIESFTDDLFFIIDELKLKKPVICGLSMGGYITLRAVERNEKIFRALILLDTKSEADSNEAKLKRAEGIKIINTLGLENFVKPFIQNCFSQKSIEEMGKEYTKIVERAAGFDPAGVKGCLLAMAGRTDTSDYLVKIKIPTLILCGEKDALTPPPVMESMAERIKDSEYSLIFGAGHMTPLESPDEVNEIILEFLSRVI